MKKILITGGCGFIGSHTIREILKNKEIELLINLDALTYSGNPTNLQDLKDERYRFIHGSINDYELVMSIIKERNIQVILNLAAESHVDRSIDSAVAFIETNIKGTMVLLECIKNRKSVGHEVHLIHVSTDEVYGSLGPEDPEFTEKTPLDPKNPYSASKASSDFLVNSFVNTFQISAIITRCSNNYGPNQFPEKLIPLMTIRALNGESLPVYGDGMQIRDWIHVTDHAKGIITAMEGLIKGIISPGEVINFGASNEVRNIEIVKQIIKLTNSSEEQISYVEDRPGHDRRYAMGYEKAKKALGWEPEIGWDDGLRQTIGWYEENSDWIDKILNGTYQ